MIDTYSLLVAFGKKNMLHHLYTNTLHTMMEMKMKINKNF